MRNDRAVAIPPPARRAEWLLRATWLQDCVSYHATIDAAAFQSPLTAREDGGVRIHRAAPGRSESQQRFRVPIARNRIQSVWIQIENDGQQHDLFFQQIAGANAVENAEETAQQRPAERSATVSIAATRR